MKGVLSLLRIMNWKASECIKRGQHQTEQTENREENLFLSEKGQPAFVTLTWQWDCRFPRKDCIFIHVRIVVWTGLFYGLFLHSFHRPWIQDAFWLFVLFFDSTFFDDAYLASILQANRRPLFFVDDSMSCWSVSTVCSLSHVFRGHPSLSLQVTSFHSFDCLSNRLVFASGKTGNTREHTAQVSITTL